jgi:hypothetical protein
MCVFRALNIHVSTTRHEVASHSPSSGLATQVCAWLILIREIRRAVFFAKSRPEILASRAGLAFLAVLLATATGFAVYQFSRDEDYFIPFIGMAFIDFLVVVGAIAPRWSVRRRAEQLHSDGKGLYAPTNGHVDGICIRSQADGVEAALAWDAFCSYRNSDRIAIPGVPFKAILHLMVCALKSHAPRARSETPAVKPPLVIPESVIATPRGCIVRQLEDSEPTRIGVFWHDTPTR